MSLKYFFYQIIVFFWRVEDGADEINWVVNGRNECVYVKDWLKSIFPPLPSAL